MRGGFLPILIAAATPYVVIIIIVVSLSFPIIAWRPMHLWSVQFQDSNQAESVTALAFASNELYVGSSTIFAPDGQSSGFIRAFDNHGRQSWNTTFGTDSFTVTGIVPVIDGEFVGGEGNSTGVVAKYDLVGNKLWSTVFSNTAVGRIYSIAGQKDNVFLSGVAPINGTVSQIVRGYDGSGNLLWTHVLGNATAEYAHVFADSSGVYVISSEDSGRFDTKGYVEKYTNSGMLLWKKSFDDALKVGCRCAPKTITGDPNGVYIAGSAGTDLSGAPLSISQVFVLQYGLTGEFVKGVQFESPDSKVVDQVGISSGSSGLYLTIESLGPSPFLMKLDSALNQVWSLQLSGHAPPVPAALPITAADRGVYVGSWTRMGSSSPQAMVAEFDQSTSFVFFGTFPPVSYIIVGVFAGSLPLVYILGRAYWKKKRNIRSQALKNNLKRPRV